MKYFSTEYERKATIGTILFHLALLFAFLYFALSVPLPLPEEEGILINFGTTETGQGEEQPQDVSKEITAPQPTKQTKVQSAPETVKGVSTVDSKTQTVEESANISKEATKNISETSEVKKIEERKPDVSKLYPGSTKSNSSSEGNTGGTGDQGKKEGSFDSKNRAGGGTFGKGNSYSLGGRSLINSPDISNFSETGKIVVEIIVDRSGKVISARSGVKGTTVSNQTQQEQARQAAMKAQFSPNPDADVQQIGTITFNYSFN